MIIGEIPENGMIAADLNSTLSFDIIAKVGCQYSKIKAIDVIGPDSLLKQSVSFIEDLKWSVNVQWKPMFKHKTKICAIGTDSSHLSTNMVCYTILAGYSIPKAIKAGPEGQLNQTLFENATGHVQFYVKFNTIEIKLNTKSCVRIFNSLTNEEYLNILIDQTNSKIDKDTLMFHVPVYSLGSGSYYVLLDYGIVTGLENQYSDRVIDKNFWKFNIPGSLTSRSTTTKTTTTTIDSNSTITTTTTEFDYNSISVGSFMHTNSCINNVMSPIFIFIIFKIF